MKWQKILERGLAAADEEVERDLDEIGAEGFFELLQVNYRPDLVQVYRLHILQRFHDYLQGQEPPNDETAALELAGAMLRRAHDDFVASKASTQAALRVYQRANSGDGKGHEVVIPLARIGRNWTRRQKC